MNKDLKKPHILITNDDGIHAQGIKHLWNCLRNHAHVTVVAPAYEQSAVGLCTTLRAPIRLDKLFWEHERYPIWSVTGTPADCVKMALNAILDSKPDLVISGINKGGNMGKNVLYSGTVAAAIESIMQEIPSVAFSCYDYFIEPDYKTAAEFASSIIKYVLNHPMPKGTLLNVNFPERHHGAYKGLKMTKQGQDWWLENPDKRTHPHEGNTYYWLGGKLQTNPNVDEDEDGSWLRRGYVTAVPVRVTDLTDHDHLKSVRVHFEQHFCEE